MENKRTSPGDGQAQPSFLFFFKSHKAPVLNKASIPAFEQSHHQVPSGTAPHTLWGLWGKRRGPTPRSPRSRGIYKEGDIKGWFCDTEHPKIPINSSTATWLWRCWRSRPRFLHSSRSFFFNPGLYFSPPSPFAFPRS